MAKTIEKIILGILIIAILSTSTVLITGLDDESKTMRTTTNSPQISLEQAKSIALRIQEGTVTEAFLENDNGVLAYEIEVTNGNEETEIKIDPSTGNILSTETETEEPVTVQELVSAEITEEKAKEIALNEVSGRVIKVDTEKENGRVLYEIEIQDGNDVAEVEIDAETGEVLEVEFGDDDEDEE